MTVIQKKIFAFVAIGILSAMQIFFALRSQPNDDGIYNYLTYIDGFVFISVGLYSSLLVFGIYKPKYKTQDKQASMEDMLRKNGNLLKFCSITMLIYGAYILIRHDPNMYRLNSDIEASKWTNRDKEIFIKECLRMVDPKLKNHHQIALGYCTCAFDSVVKDMTKKQYVYELSLSNKEQHDKFEPLLEGCRVNLRLRIDSVEKTK